MTIDICAKDLATALERFGDGISVLSLDCFDTLIWRSTNAPTDVFADLKPDPGPRCRTFAESMARQVARITHWRSEVAIRDIYRQCWPGADRERIEQAVADELLAERAHCFAFAPTVALMQAAKSRGMRVIIVSDTYLDATELRALIADSAGPEVAALIDAVYCSSEWGASKGDGLFGRILPHLGVAPGEILHLGDNRAADYESSRRFGVRGVHIVQFDPQWVTQLRLEAAIATIFDPAIRVERPALQLQRAALSLGGGMTDAHARLGYGVVGPILTGFAHWLLAEFAALRDDPAAGGAALRPLFLLRDGYLPQQVYARTPGADAFPTRQAEISRFSAFASSFVDERSVLSYLAEFVHTQRFDALTRQLLFTPSESRTLIERSRAAARPIEAFVAEIRKPHTLRKVLARSDAYAQRLVTYLREHCGIEAGQTLVLVDLGYAGTVQDRVAPVLRNRMGVRVVGRYLALRDVPGWRDDKRGLIGPDRYDHRTIDALCAYIAVLEQLCTAEMASVVDYDTDGTPIRKSTDMKQRQSQVRADVQAACLRYAQWAGGAMHRAPAAFNADGWRTTVAGSLGRLLFLPSDEEIALFEGFEHDVNMGVDDKVQLFDPQDAHDGLLKRGLFYTNDNPRQYLPAEVRSEGMSTSMLLIAQRRFGLDLRRTDFHHDAVRLPIMIADGPRLTESFADAHPTHEGYLMAAIPIADSRYAIGLKFGAAFEWLQLHSLTVTRQRDFMGDGDLTDESDRLDAALFEGIERHAGGLLRCARRDGFVFVPPPARADAERRVLTVVFRPIAAAPGVPARPATAPADPGFNADGGPAATAPSASLVKETA
jgi:FMN phosphatase YigB (HAD superfamily)